MESSSREEGVETNSSGTLEHVGHLFYEQKLREAVKYYDVMGINN